MSKIIAGRQGHSQFGIRLLLTLWKIWFYCSYLSKKIRAQKPRLGLDSITEFLSPCRDTPRLMTLTHLWQIGKIFNDSKNGLNSDINMSWGLHASWCKKRALISYQRYVHYSKIIPVLLDRSKSILRDNWAWYNIQENCFFLWVH